MTFFFPLFSLSPRDIAYIGLRDVEPQERLLCVPKKTISPLIDDIFNDVGNEGLMCSLCSQVFIAELYDHFSFHIHLIPLIYYDSRDICKHLGIAAYTIDDVDKDGIGVIIEKALEKINPEYVDKYFIQKIYLMLCSNAQTFQHLLHAISAKGFFLKHR